MEQICILVSQKKLVPLGFPLFRIIPFIDGNKRIGHAAMEVFLVMNGYELNAPTDDQEQVILKVAAGQLDREGLTQWLRKAIVACNC